MPRKTLLLTLLILTTLFQGTAAITSIDIVNQFPYQDTRETGTTTVVRLASDSTTTTTAELWVTKPNANTIKISEQDLSVKSGNPKETTYQVSNTIIDQYGEYTFTVNETNNQLNSTITTIVTPKPEVKTTLQSHIYLNEDVEDMQINVQTQTGETIPLDEINPGTAEIYDINDDPNTTGVEKTLVNTVNLSLDPKTNHLETSLPLQTLGPGDYEVVARFNISSCDICQDYESTTRSTFLIRDGFDRLTYQEKWGDRNSTILSTFTNVSDISERQKNSLKDTIKLHTELTRDTLSPQLFGNNTPVEILVLILILIQVLTLATILIK